MRPLLGAGERLLWSGRPKLGLTLRGADAFLIPFALFWCTITIVMPLTAGNGASILFTIPFALFGLYMLVGRFWLDARQRAHTFYGVTDQRVIIMTGILTPSVKSLYLGKLPDLTVNEKPDGSGTITFGPWTGRGQLSQAFPSWAGMDSQPVLFLQSDVRRVADIIRTANVQS